MLTHVDEYNQPAMVDITDKNPSHRVAVAQSTIRFPAEMSEHIRDGEIYLKKGPVFQTAVIAGTMAVKKTYEVIPFCHQIPVESCKFSWKWSGLDCTITCTVKTTYKTGVEMEALHGVSVASLTVYDMCKALSQQMIIQETKLIKKTGGKTDVLRRPLYGLVLTGGKSSRMNRDKALIDYHGKPHARYLFDLLGPYCDQVFLSARSKQWEGTVLQGLPVVEDLRDTETLGPIAGILAAFRSHSEVDWLIVACDLPYVDARTVEKLKSEIDDAAVACCFKNIEKGFPEPLCAVYTPLAHAVFEEAARDGVRCPVKILSKYAKRCHLLEQADGVDLANVNTPQEFAEVRH